MAIGTTAALIGSAVIGGVAQSSAARRATNAQTSAANNDIALRRGIYDDQTRRFEPYYQGGEDFRRAYQYELLGGEAPTMGGRPMDITEVRRTQNVGLPNAGFAGAGTGVFGAGNLPWANQQNALGSSFRVGDQTFNTRAEAEAYAAANMQGGTPYRGFEATPGYAFQRQEGQDAVNALAGANGGLFSGATLDAQTRLSQGLAAQEYNNYLNRLAGGTDMGLSAAGMQATAGSNAAQGIGNAYNNIGNAQSAGAIAQGNAWGGALQGVAGAIGYQNALSNPYNQATGSGNWWQGTR